MITAFTLGFTGACWTAAYWSIRAQKAELEVIRLTALIPQKRMTTTLDNVTYMVNGK